MGYSIHPSIQIVMPKTCNGLLLTTSQCESSINSSKIQQWDLVLKDKKEVQKMVRVNNGVLYAGEQLRKLGPTNGNLALK